jgi:hypothetical protein
MDCLVLWVIEISSGGNASRLQGEPDRLSNTESPCTNKGEAQLKSRFIYQVFWQASGGYVQNAKSFYSVLSPL